jgi:hypothetical protein
MLMATPASPEQTHGVQFPPIQVTIPLLATLVYASLLVTGYNGFGHPLGAWQPIPVYVALSILLLALQADISRNRSIGRFLYLFGTSGFALVYAGAAFFFSRTANFIREPVLYLVLNIFVVAVFIYDTIARRLDERRHPYAERWAGDPYGEWAGDFSGLAILFGISALLLDLLGPHRLWGQFFQGLPQVIRDTGEVELPLLPGAFHTLESADVALALAAAGIALFFVVILGILSVIPALTPPPALQRQTKTGNAVQQFLGQLGATADLAIDRVLLSLRLVLGPLVWFIPAFSIAAFSAGVRDYFDASFADQSGGIGGLFFPLSPTALNNIGPGFLVLLLGVVAIGTVVIAVAVVEHDRTVIANTMRVLGIAGRAIALVLAIALYSLALINAFAVYVHLTDGRPFQVGASGLGALAFGIIFTIYPLIFDRVTGRTKARQSRDPAAP